VLNSGYDLRKGDFGIRFRQTVWIGRYSGVQLALGRVLEHYVQFGQRFDNLIQSDDVRMVHLLHARDFARQKTPGLRIQSCLIQYLHCDLL